MRACCRPLAACRFVTSTHLYQRWQWIQEIQLAGDRYLEANSITNAKQRGGIARGSGAGGGLLSQAADGGTYWSPMDLKLVDEIRRTPNILRLLVSSLCPAIFGQEVVKAGLILAMVSGVSRGGGIHGARAAVSCVPACGRERKVAPSGAPR